MLPAMPRENLEDTIARSFAKLMEDRDQKQKEKDDPRAWLEGMVRRVFNEEFDKRLNEGKGSGGEGEDDDDKGFLAKLVGG